VSGWSIEKIHEEIESNREDGWPTSQALCDALEWLLEKHQWKPIEDAPKQWVNLLLLFPETIGDIRCVMAGYFNSSGDLVDQWGGSFLRHPTHFQVAPQNLEEESKS